MKRRRLGAALGCLLVLALSGCAAFGLGQRAPQTSHAIVLRSCPDSHLTVTVTKPVSPSSSRVLYLTAGGSLYALNGATGKVSWCDQVTITGEFSCSGPCPMPPMMLFGEPAIADGVVYVCASGYGDGLTYAFRARDGVLLWHATSDCWSVAMPFGDNAIPLIDHGVVYSGSRALSAHDGHIIWTTHIGLAEPRYISFQSLADGLLYANDDTSIYAISAKDGSVRWKYTAPDGSPPGGRLIVADGRVYYGTLDSVDSSEKSTLYVLDAAKGTLIWKSATAAYSNPAYANGLIYIGAANDTLDALQASDGAIRWQWHNQAAYPASAALTATKGVLYAVADGPYALDAATGKVIWHESLNADQSVAFTPVTVIGNVVYLVRIDGEGTSALFALDAAAGTVHWQSSTLPQGGAALAA